MLVDQFTAFFNDFKAMMQVIAPLIAFIGVVGIGCIYMGSGWPIIGPWKQRNPDMANSFVIGLLLVVGASTITGFISFT